MTIILGQQSGSSSRPFWQDLILQLSGPLLAALVGSLAVGLILSAWSTRKADRAAIRDLRIALIDGMVEAAACLRAANLTLGRARSLEVSAVDLAELQRAARVAYNNALIRTSVLETKLAAFFPDKRVGEAWHGAMDCLFIQYFNSLSLERRIRDAMIEQFVATPGKAHSGLSLEESADNNKVVNKSGSWLDTAVLLVRQADLEIPLSSAQQGARSGGR